MTGIDLQENEVATKNCSVHPKSRADELAGTRDLIVVFSRLAPNLMVQRRKTAFEKCIFKDA